jgi:hypothetical protein
MDGVDKLEGADLITVFSCTEYGGKYGNSAACILIKKNCDIISKSIEPMKGMTEWVQPQGRNLIFQTRAAEDENDLRTRPFTPPRNLKR